MSKKNEHAVSMKTELSVTKVTKRGDGQASGGDQDQPAEITTMEQTSEVRVTIITSWGEKLNKLKDALTEAAQEQNAEPKIQKVPFLLRDHKNFDNYYEPRVVAFGPYHHGKRKYERAEKVKLQLAAHFITDSHHDQTNYGETLLKMVEDKIKELRECYDEEATKDYGDEVLAWMLFVDGCSMLEFIYKYDNLEEINIKRDRVAFADQDMLLLENQLPYRLLKWLFDKSKIREKFNNSIEAFVKMHGGEPKVNATEREPLHLLDLLRTRMVRPPSPSSKPGCTQLLDRLWKRKAGPPRTEPGSHSFRNVQELQAAGIYFRPSDEKSLRAISFKPWFQCCGFLYLPKIKVDDSMGPKFMNMIAYEMCPDFQNDFGVTSYIGFLDSLIDHPDDVKHLRKKRIVQNLLGSDEEVARLFNEIGTDLVPNNAIYRNVTAQIEDHYKTKWKTWMTQFFHDHFSSPWTIFAFFGVLLGLGLSGAQTWYAIFSNPSPCDAVCKYLKTHPG
ncbi:hypothetical protein D8674_008695 [Pyrus ussuriensis x Pyrus communis]|uniref:Uncharacterized protein n=1 Tax=Pyrus ussuriensis x Pyrus communis TaxID=2448454 RepID=A0A5N5HTG5_9ROSA|nr:hypothetical protein D8674_008695 [Pyrus ussuriensis x Pyrus communis]